MVDKESGEVVINRDGREVRFELGTVSEGTLKDEDLILAFESWLEAVDPKGLEELIRLVEDEDGEQGDEYWLDSLWDTMEGYAPEGHYFGAHLGDGANFGFWEDDNSIVWEE